ncbi:dsDNA nuclease domain-containing protein [Methanoculleus bourgensis]|uniref:dsDNA nuclease domain-containing protein n=1 Tax=Methanoculleus bourgensis TaxID=83986 RepID=UPI0022EEE5E0|nr:dsDNA nuclease domain-containing protein [Methanoculleus bourgensis]GLI45434.1 hypothetical protein MBOURGENBZM_02260 [Methanoculleus bourgensis]
MGGIRKNPTSSIRRGLDYQDCWAIKLLIEWIENPKKYRWIRFETVPVEAEKPNKFFLDDIVACDVEDNYHLYQIKHRQNPDSEKLQLCDLLKREKNKKGVLKNSPIMKWFSSYFNIKETGGGITQASLVTNAIPDEELKQYILNNKINIDNIRKGDPEVYEEIEQQLGDITKISAFFSEFKFIFCEKSVEELEATLKDHLLKEIRLTESGVNNLFLNVHKESRKSEIEDITYEKVLAWCEFDRPRHLDQNFEVPDDFQIFDNACHEATVKELRNPQGGIKVFYGKPGSGKSTYLAKLSQTLKSSGIFCVNHHYYISNADTEFNDRLISDRVKEALKAEFKISEQEESLGDLAYKNSSNTPLREYIRQLASSHFEKGKPFVLIIDGLDHVPRYADKEELLDLLNEISFLASGYWLILGTQESASKYFPQIIVDHCPETNWIEVEGLDRDSIQEIIEYNDVNLCLPQNELQMYEFIDKIIEVTDKSPLVLRYTLNQLKNSAGTRIVTAYDCRDLIPYSGDIEQYYQRLWRSIPAEAQTIANLLASVNIRFTEEQLNDLLPCIIHEPHKISESYQAISHLLKNEHHKILPYHSSFEQFITSTQEYIRQKISLKKKIQAWLNGSAYEDLDWAEAKILSYELGDPGPLLSIDESWLIEALCHPREIRLITTQLAWAAEAAFKQQEFGLALKFSRANDYLRDVAGYTEARDLIWGQAFESGKRDGGNYDLKSLNASQIYLVVHSADKMGCEDLLHAALEQLREMHNKRPDIFLDDGLPPELPLNFIKALTLKRDHQVSNVYRYISQFVDSGWSGSLLEVYVTELLRTEQYLKIDELYNHLSPSEKGLILNCLARYDLVTKGSRYLDLILRSGASETTCLLYLFLRDETTQFIPPLPDHRELAAMQTKLDLKIWGKIKDTFTDAFIVGILYGLYNRNSEILTWIEKAGSDMMLRTVAEIYIAGLATASLMQASEPVDYSLIFSYLNRIKIPDGQSYNDKRRLTSGLRSSLSEVLKIIYLITSNREKIPHLCINDLKDILSGNYYSRNDLLEFLTLENRQILDDEAYYWFVHEKKKELKGRVSPFHERAKEYALLSKLSTIHSDREHSGYFLRQAAWNFVGYGYHKDMYLDEVLDTIRVCYTVNPKMAMECLREVIPLIEHVGEYTDGDHTRYFPGYLADLLGTMDKQILFNYYLTKIDENDWDLAETIFNSIVRSLNFDDIDKGIAATAIDRYSFRALESLSEENYAAKEVLDDIQEILGPIDYSERGTSSYIPYSTPEMDYSTVSPDLLIEQLKTLEEPWDQAKYLTGWLRHWLERPEGDRRKIRSVANKIIEESPRRYIFTEALDLLYPLEYQFDSNKAFEYACLAQSDSGNWYTYGGREEELKQRWDFVKAHYPERYLEFFGTSIRMTATRYRSEVRYFVPIPRSVEFFALFDEVENIEEITRASVEFAKFLMADLKPSDPIWIKPRETDNRDILFSRLLWPSPLVRERAATAISLLLRVSPKKETIFRRLLQWLHDQKLESIIAMALLPILHAAREQPEGVAYIRTQNIVEHLPSTSLVVETLVAEIAAALNQPLALKPCRSTIPEVPFGFKPPEHFSRTIRTVLPQVYADIGESILDESHADFITRWAYTSEDLKKRYNIKEGFDDVHYYGNAHSPILTGMSTTASEVHRSSFLRVLQYYRDRGVISEGFFRDYTYMTLPIDLSFWRIQPSRAPVWWPGIGEDAQEDIGQINAEIRDAVTRLIKKEGDSRVLALEGAVRPSTGWNDDLASRVTLVGFACQVTGDNIPGPASLEMSPLHSPLITLDPLKTQHPFRILEQHDEHEQVGHALIVQGDLILYPLIARLMTLPVNLWQWYRGYHLPFALSSDISEGLQMRTDETCWYYEEEESVVARGEDWLEGLKERYKPNYEIPHGTYLEIDTDYLTEYLNRNSCKLGYILEINHYYRKKSYSDPEILKNTEFLGIEQDI